MRALAPLVLVLLAACQTPTRTLMIPVAASAEADLAALHARWRCPLVVVRGVVYVPPPESLPLADAGVRAALADLAASPPLAGDARVLALPAHAVRGHPQFVVRGTGYRRVQVYRGGRLLDARDSVLDYLPAER